MYQTQKLFMNTSPESSGQPAICQIGKVIVLLFRLEITVYKIFKEYNNV